MKKQLRKIKGAYAYKKTETTSVSTIELDDCINTKEEYKAVLSLLISVLENEYDLEIHDIKCNEKTISFKISEGDGFDVVSDNEYSCNKNDMFEPREEIAESDFEDDEFDRAFDICKDQDGVATIEDLCEYLEVTDRTIRSRLKEFEDEYLCSKGKVRKVGKKE